MKELCGLVTLIGNYIKDNHNKETYAGKLLKDCLDKEDYVLVNATDRVKNGPFTRYDVANLNDDSKKSTIDLVIVSKDLLEYIAELEIDKNREWTPHRRKNDVLKHPDHYALLLKFVDIPRKRNAENMPPKKVVTWNLKKRNGWEKCK